MNEKTPPAAPVIDGKPYVALGWGGKFKTNGNFWGIAWSAWAESWLPPSSREPKIVELEGGSTYIFYYAPADSEVARLNNLVPDGQQPFICVKGKRFVRLGEGGTFKTKGAVFLSVVFIKDCNQFRLDPREYSGDSKNWIYYVPEDSEIVLLNASKGDELKANDELKSENQKLRKAICEIIDYLGNQSAISEGCSSTFLVEFAPLEVKRRVDTLKHLLSNAESKNSRLEKQVIELAQKQKELAPYIKAFDALRDILTGK